MKKDLILQAKETRRKISSATWVPLRANLDQQRGDITKPGYTKDIFCCGSVAFPPEHRGLADSLSWCDIGIGHLAQPIAFDSGQYSSIDQYQYHDEETVGVELVYEYQNPVVGKRQWILNPDIVVALRLIKEGNNWVRPEEGYVVVAREKFDADGNHSLIEIKREFLMDYLAARSLSLRVSSYRQRVENVLSLEDSEHHSLSEQQDDRDGGRFELRIRRLDEIYGGAWASFRAWRTDIDEDEDAPVMGPESSENTEFESSEGTPRSYPGTRVESEFWRDEWVEHEGRSVRVRGDADLALPQFIVGTDGKRMESADLNDENVGRWLWFKPGVVENLLKHRGFSLQWFTKETGGLCSTSGYTTHFGINSSDFVTVYASDIARLPGWEQRIWAANNVVPEGKVSGELLAAQVNTQPASTQSAENMLFLIMRRLESCFNNVHGGTLFNSEIDDYEAMQKTLRFASSSQASLLALAKEVVRVFSDRLNIPELRKISTHKDKKEFRSNRLLQDVLAKEVGEEKARKIMGPIVGVYEMRVGDAHPTGSSIGEAMKLAGIDESLSYLRQGEQLILNFGRAVWNVGYGLFGAPNDLVE
jgi:hypothetical protein